MDVSDSSGYLNLKISSFTNHNIGSNGGTSKHYHN